MFRYARDLRGPFVWEHGGVSWTGELESEADAVRTDLNLDVVLATVGVPHLVGSARSASWPGAISA